MELNEISTKTKWSIDQSYSEITFKAKHLLFAHIKSVFKNFDAQIYTTSNDFSNVKIELWIDASSISTGDLKSDEYFKSINFFDVKNHNQIKFCSNAVGKPDSSGNHELWGDLTMKGITNKIKLNFSFKGFYRDTRGKEKAAFSVLGKINIKDWGFFWNTALEARGYSLSDEVTVSCEIELTNIGQKHSTIKLEHSKKRYSLVNPSAVFLKKY